MEDPRMLKKAADDGPYPDVLGHAGHAGPQTPKTTHDQLDGQWNGREQGSLHHSSAALLLFHFDLDRPCFPDIGAVVADGAVRGKLTHARDVKDGHARPVIVILVG